MTMIKYLILGLTLILATLVAGQEVVPDDVEFDPRALDRAEIQLQVIKTSPMLPRLPILVEVVISNPSAQDILIPLPTLSARENPYNTLDILSVRGRDTGTPGRTKYLIPTFTPWKEGLPPERPRLMRLRPNQSWSARIPVSCDWQGEDPKVIVDVGTLQLSAKLCAVERDPDGQWVVRRDQGKTSNVLRVEVPEPAGEDAAALTELMRRERSWLLCAPQAADHLTHGKDFQFLQEFAARHPRSAYALYAKAVLAHMLAWGDRLDLHPSRPPDLVSALRLLDEMLSDPRFLLRDDANELRRKLTSQATPKKE
jgi:hypothetical protein